MNNISNLDGYIEKERKNEAMDIAGSLDSSSMSGLRLKNLKVTVILSVFLGFLGIDRLYQGGIKMFLCKLCMLALTFGTWWLADIYYTKHCASEDNFRKLCALAA